MLPWTKWRRLGGGRYSDVLVWDGAACYELGVGRSAKRPRKKYVGQTVNLKRRMREYLRPTSHIYDFIWKDLMSGNHLYYRAFALPTKHQAEKKEREILDDYDYEWNRLNNSDPFKKFLALSHDRSAKVKKVTLYISGTPDGVLPLTRPRQRHRLARDGGERRKK